MSGKLLLWLLIGFGLLAASSAWAEEFCYGQLTRHPDGSLSNPCYQSKCYRGLDGQGGVISWVKTENQCRWQSTGQSWGNSGGYRNIYRDYGGARWR